MKFLFLLLGMKQVKKSSKELKNGVSFSILFFCWYLWSITGGISSAITTYQKRMENWFKKRLKNYYNFVITNLNVYRAIIQTNITKYTKWYSILINVPKYNKVHRMAHYTD